MEEVVMRSWRRWSWGDGGGGDEEMEEVVMRRWRGGEEMEGVMRRWRKW